jgi:F0F1-type ATP synthase delta subunit
MKSISRRKLANYAVDEMLNSLPSHKIAEQISSELINSGRQDEYQLLINDIYRTIEDRGISATAYVTSAYKLSESSKKIIESNTARLTKTQHVKVIEQIDPTLIAGMKLQTAKLTWDGSAKNRLKQLQLRRNNE